MVESLNSNEWNIAVSPWIIQDGNYPDFASGQDAKFALEFYSQEGLKASHQKTTGSKYLGQGRYEVVAKIVHMTERIWVIDFGILAFKEQKPPINIHAGDFVEGQIYLNIDPFFYLEYLYKQPDMPKLSYRWNVKSIYRHLAPLINHPTQTNTFIGDQTQEVAEPITKMDAWHDEKKGMSCYYILNCRLLSDPELP